jgi:hypothetical protein
MSERTIRSTSMYRDNKGYISNAKNGYFDILFAKIEAQIHAQAYSESTIYTHLQPKYTIFLLKITFLLYKKITSTYELPNDLGTCVQNLGSPSENRIVHT